MTLSDLEGYLQTVTGTSIKEVVLDSDIYFAVEREKSYPFVLWQLDGSEFEKDYRTFTIQETKIITFPVFAIINFDTDTESKITVWDTLEAYFKTYINKIHEMDSLKVVNIDKLKGTYIWNGTRSPDKELGMLFREVQLKLYC